MQPILAVVVQVKVCACVHSAGICNLHDIVLCVLLHGSHVEWSYDLSVVTSHLHPCPHTSHTLCTCFHYLQFHSFMSPTVCPAGEQTN